MIGKPGFGTLAASIAATAMTVVRTPSRDMA